jgi:hypothetical protein
LRVHYLFLQNRRKPVFFQLFFRNSSYTTIKYKERVSCMSKKKDILIVGFLSATLFAGFTAYSQLGAKVKAAAPPAPAESAVRPAGEIQDVPLVKNSTQQPIAVQAPTDGAIEQPPTDQAPPAGAARKKNTKTKAS